MFELVWLDRARSEFDALERAATGGNAKGRFKQVKKALRFLAENPRHPSLASHKFQSLDHPTDPDKSVFVAYAQNNTPGAYRIFWSYGPGHNQIFIISIAKHPD